MRRGGYRSRAPIPRGYGELGNMARVFNDMAESLTLRHQQLLQAHERLNRLTRHLQIVRESESQRIARDLHDEIGQVLTSIKIDLCGFEGKRSEGSGFSCKSSIDGVLAKIDGLVKFVRQIASQLRPPVLDRIGVVFAIELLDCDSEQNTGIIADYRVLDVKEPWTGFLSITIYRIVQEALTNISRHAKASKVTIVLRQDEGKILLEINDDGAGFVYGDEFRNSLGIIGMQERAGLVGGSFELISAPGEGTSIRVEIPIDGTTEGTFTEQRLQGLFR
ncbi:MAG: histidine kinase [Cyanobacteriota/Melainabacteria group bacterium]